MDGCARSDALQSALEKIDRILAAIRLRFPTASENLRNWRDGGGRNQILPANVFQNQRFLLDHLRDNDRPKITNGTKRRLISGEVVPGQSGIETTYADTLKAPPFTDLFFALGTFTVRSTVQTAVVRGDGLLILRLDHWQIEISTEYDWDPHSWGLLPGVSRLTHEELHALQFAGYGRRFLVRSEWGTIIDPEVTAPATLPAGNY
jgi:hypothetical protein